MCCGVYCLTCTVRPRAGLFFCSEYHKLIAVSTGRERKIAAGTGEACSDRWTHRTRIDGRERRNFFIILKIVYDIWDIGRNGDGEKTVLYLDRLLIVFIEYMY